MAERMFCHFGLLFCYRLLLHVLLWFYYGNNDSSFTNILSSMFYALDI